MASGWWPSFRNQSGAYELNGDGSGTIVTGAQENGSGAVMALPLLVADVLGMKPSDFSILYQDTDAAPFDAGSSGSQTTMNNGRAVVEAAGEVRELLDLAAEQLELAQEDLGLVDGRVQVVGTPSKAVEIAELAGSENGCSARARPDARARLATQKKAAWNRLGMESFLEPQVFTHAARVKVDRETGVVRVLQVAAAHAARLRRDSQPPRRHRAGVRRRRHGNRSGAPRGLPARRRGRQRNPHLLDYRLVTASDTPRIDVAWIETPAQNGGPKGTKGVGEPRRCRRRARSQTRSPG